MEKTTYCQNLEFITLQNFVFPKSLDFGSKEKYYRSEGSVEFDGTALILPKDSAVKFDTFYNAFSIPLWQKRVKISDAELIICGSGKVVIELWEYNDKYINTLIESKTFDLKKESQSIFYLNVADSSYTGLVFPKIKALTEVKINSLAWITVEKPRQQVKLGISITHFNRKNYVLPAMKRIRDNFLNDTEWQDKIDFVVVDNSKNITAEEAMGVKIIPNENTGGSGGFMRGLLHYKNETDVTHVLFMDDDASLEVESIRRAYRILQFTNDSKTAVGASLFYEDKPDILIERGAVLDPGPVWMAKYRDSWGINQETILHEELEDTSNDYGGWWFFAFPVKEAKHLTPPYFVRGDDVSFSSLNDFHVVFANGISCMAENFQYKFAPMTEYLDMRNKLIVSTIFLNSKKSAINYYKWLAQNQLLAGRYGYVEVLKLALNDYLNLTSEWMEKNINMADKISEINSFAKDNIQRELDLSQIPVELNTKMGEHRFITLFKMFFMPLRTDKVVIQRAEILPIFQQMTGYKKVLTYNPETNKGFIVEISKKKLFSGIFSIWRDCWRIRRNYGEVRKRLLDNLDYLTSEEMWNEILFPEKEK
ncbi:glycosyltransferase [Lactovum odontotermitis]